ncbi:hypothetical protein F2Q70_00021197 [Brassica cretica]|uniref:RNase H type-1 domain-containing protein n=1 Tax=Brassica cretica TaxID=69181 RepID=A0A8S9GKJ8_BRACR|nr:hypothetical protein F2Q70_00021197 [Brassica cretica]
MGTRNFTRCESALHSEVEALRWAMKNMLEHSPCQSFGTDCKELIAMINEPQEWPSFATELEKIETLQICFPDFKIIHVPRVRSQFSDSGLVTTSNLSDRMVQRMAHDVLRDVALRLSNHVEVNRRERLLMPRRESMLPREWEENNNQPFDARIVSIHTWEMNDWIGLTWNYLRQKF